MVSVKAKSQQKSLEIERSIWIANIVFPTKPQEMEVKAARKLEADSGPIFEMAGTTSRS